MNDQLDSPSDFSDPKGQWEIPETADHLDDPLLSCLELLTKLHGRPFSVESLRSGLPLREHRLTPSLFVRAASRAGLSAKIVARDLGKVSKLVLPAVMLLQDNQAAILVDVDHAKDTLVLIQPETGGGKRKARLSQIQARYSGYCIFVRPKYRFDERTSSVLAKSQAHWFWGAMQENRKIYRDVLVASLFINLLIIAIPLYMRNVFDRVLPNSAYETLWVLSAGVLAVFVFDFLLKNLRGYFLDQASKRVEMRVSSRLFEQVMGIRMAHRPSSTGAFAGQLREFEGVRDFITSATMTGIIDAPFAVLFLLVIYWIGGSMVLIPLATIPLIILYTYYSQRATKEAVIELYRGGTQRNAALVEGINGIETIKFLGAEGLLQRKWEDNIAHSAEWGRKGRILSSSAVHFTTAVTNAAIVATIIYGVYLVDSGELTAGGLFACFILMRFATRPAGKVASLASRYYQVKATLQSLEQLMSLPVERPEGKNFVSRSRFKGDIEFDSVAFAYPDQGKNAVRNVSFKVHAGERVALIGRIGSGKTTLAKLVQGLFEVDVGSVRIDGIDVNQIDPGDIRRNIGYIPQDITLFHGTVRDNILLGAPHAEDKMLIRAARLAGVHRFVNKHPLGFDMPVGERGSRLSGGQRQSIAIARALLQNPPILVMDEPTNSMDNTTESQIKKNLKKISLGKTLLVVTHRNSLLDLVDRIIVIDDGSIVADGAKAEVIMALQQGKLKIS